MVVRPTDTNFRWIPELYDANLDTAVVKKLIRIHFTKNGPSEKSWMTQPCGLPLSPDIHYYRRKWHRLQLSWLSQFNKPIAAISTSPSIMNHNGNTNDFEVDFCNIKLAIDKMFNFSAQSVCSNNDKFKSVLNNRKLIRTNDYLSKYMLNC